MLFSSSRLHFDGQVAALIIFLLTTFASQVVVMANENDETARLQKNIRSFPSGRSRVYVVPDFLPHELAVQWRDIMAQEWDKRSTCAPSDSSCGGDSPSWTYATNNNGSNSKRASNSKVRSLEKIEERQAFAYELKQTGRFSYAKWELDPSHALVKQIEEKFAERELRDLVAQLITSRSSDEPPSQQKVDLLPDLSDLFVTYYAGGDFLSPHDDGVSGTFAFVISLMDCPSSNEQCEWRDEFGGQLRFQCPGQRIHPGASISWCETLQPSFNTAISFRTRIGNVGAGPQHEVLPVTQKADEAGYRRFGLTGWYQDAYDVMSETDKRERDKMRARD